jgi:hypothetical protein
MLAAGKKSRRSDITSERLRRLGLTLSPFTHSEGRNQNQYLSPLISHTGLKADLNLAWSERLTVASASISHLLREI